MKFADHGHVGADTEGALLELERRALRPEVRAQMRRRPMGRDEVLPIVWHPLDVPALHVPAPAHVEEGHVRAAHLDLNLRRVNQADHEVHARKGERHGHGVHAVVQLPRRGGGVEHASPPRERRGELAPLHGALDDRLDPQQHLGAQGLGEDAVVAAGEHRQVLGNLRGARDGQALHVPPHCAHLGATPQRGRKANARCEASVCEEGDGHQPDDHDDDRPVLRDQAMVWHVGWLRHTFKWLRRANLADFWQPWTQRLLALQWLLLTLPR
mmetsp:Transcript_23740/g.66783  ORF Transcript_23740/g.66783 Transcript_23740/m.66783 type:complete len:269 (+) Transcript_23740:628-1434(+)